MKKLSLILATLVITVLASVPAFAATPEEIVAAARAEQEKRLADYLVYQQNLAAFQAQQIELGKAQAAAGKAAEQANFARIAAFQQQQIELGKAQAAAGKAAEAANFARIAAFQAQQIELGKAQAAAGKAAEAANFARIAQFQAQQIALGQAQAAAGKAAEQANFAAIAAFQQSQLQKQAEIEAKRAALQKQIDEYLRLVYSR